MPDSDMPDTEKQIAVKALDATAHLNEEVTRMGSKLEGLDTRLSGLETDMKDVSGGVNALLQRGSGYEATKGMIPSANVKWGITAIISSLGIAITLVVVASSNIKQGIRDEAKVSRDRHATSSEGIMQIIRDNAEASDKKHQDSSEDRKETRRLLRITQDRALVNATRSEDRYEAQQLYNSNSGAERSKLQDRQIAFYDEFEDVRRDLATKASVRDLANASYDQQKQISDIREKLATYLADLKHVQMENARHHPQIMENAGDMASVKARLNQNEEELDARWPQILEATNQLGKLSPLIDGMGLTLPVGNEQRIQTMERLIRSIDEDGSRGTNLRLKEDK